MLNQGPRPTFGESRRSLEVHLFGVDADLYGQWVRIEWVERLRDVERFASPEQLQQQLTRDRAAALDALARQGAPIDRSRASRA
jgi:riboflavin kinase/FMN adenylyltransferase